MNKSGFKRTLSLLLTLAMLCGMVAVMGAFPAAAAAEVEKFKANFSALPTGTVHRFAGVVQQPAIGGLQGENVQNTISFTDCGRIAQ